MKTRHKPGRNRSQRGESRICRQPKQDSRRAPEFQTKAAQRQASGLRVKKILVPVDFSECSTKALRYALPFARRSEAEIVLLYVLEPYWTSPEVAGVDVATLQTAACNSSQKQLREVLGGIKEQVPAQALFRIGKPDATIVAVAEEIKADLIIISTHGHTGFTHFLLGSTAERVTRHAHCPVLVVREKERDFVPIGEPEPKGVAEPPMIKAIVKEHAFFRDFSDKQIDLIAGGARELTFAPGQVIFRQGEPASEFFLVESGAVTLESHRGGQKTISIEKVGPGELVGWSWLFPPFTWHFGATALEPTKVIVFQGSNLLVAAEGDHQFGYELMKRVTQILIHRLQAVCR